MNKVIKRCYCENFLIKSYKQKWFYNFVPSKKRSQIFIPTHSIFKIINKFERLWVYLSNGSLRGAVKIWQKPPRKSCQTLSTLRFTHLPTLSLELFSSQRKFKFNNMLCTRSDNIIISFWFIWAHQADLYIDFPMKFIHEKLTFLPHVSPLPIGLRRQKLCWAEKNLNE